MDNLTGPEGYLTLYSLNEVVMKPEADPERIKELADQRADANWSFRCLLKSSDLSTRKIDSIVHRHYKEVAAQIDCRQCANCCKSVQPLLTDKDVERLAAKLRISKEQVIVEYLQTSGGEEGFSFRSMPCPFLTGNLCRVYSHRPTVCRSYPHLQKKDFVSRTIQAYANCSLCPIVFHVYEQLKGEIWRGRGRRMRREF
jgi:uncharacterized protein